MSQLIFGGTFDPIHQGHLEIALAAEAVFSFEKVMFLPCYLPALKNAPIASTEDRLTLLSLALAPYPKFEIDTREIFRKGPSYMVTTLLSYRAEVGHEMPLTLLMGMDAFNTLPKWYQWERLLTLAHIILVNRAGDSVSPVVRDFLNQHETRDRADLRSHPAGSIYHMHAGLFPYSSTRIREALAKRVYDKLPVPTAVLEYIKEHELYCAR